VKSNIRSPQRSPLMHIGALDRARRT